MRRRGRSLRGRRPHRGAFCPDCRLQGNGLRVGEIEVSAGGTGAPLSGVGWSDHCGSARSAGAIMIYTIVWLPTAEAELAQIWLDAADKNAVTQAANRID